jgi:hypothetical protein
LGSGTSVVRSPSSSSTISRTQPSRLGNDLIDGGEASTTTAAFDGVSALGGLLRYYRMAETRREMAGAIIGHYGVAYGAHARWH